MVDMIGPLPFYISVHFVSSLSNLISFIDSVQLDLSKDDKYDKDNKMARYFYRIIQRCQFWIRDDTSEKRSRNGWTKFLISYIHRG